MSLASLLGEEQTISDDITIGELRDAVGDEAVKRGLSYMLSLKEAEENYRQSIDENSDYGKNFIETFTDGDADEGMAEELTSSWERSSKKGGLGLDE